MPRRPSWPVLVFSLLSLLATTAGRAAGIPPHAIIAYHDSWDEPPADSAAKTSLVTLPAYIAVVDLAFARPDLVYDGGLDITHTGLEYRFPGRVLHNAIAMLKARLPDTSVLLSIGGSAYTDWRDLNADAVARLVHDLGADGVDIDFEPKHPGCEIGASQQIHCTTDAAWSGIVQRLRAVLPRPAILTATVWSVGAYGEGDYRTARPASRYTGVMLRFLQSPAATALDLLTIDAYDAGTAFDPMQAYSAYRAVWPGELALGLAVERRHGSGPFYTGAEAEQLARQVAADPMGAMMVYPLLAAPAGAGSDNLPDGRGLASAMCRGMGLDNCTGW
jgi:hypothetical protein